jgi:hypothetical protein
MEMVDENTCAKGCRSRRGVEGRLSWVMAGHISAAVGLEWSPPSFKNSLKRIDLEKYQDRPCFFQTPLLNQKCWHLQVEMMDENTRREM